MICICNQFVEGTHEPVASPDCPVHGAMQKRQAIDLTDGYYWVRYEEDDEWTIGRYTSKNEDGSENEYPWQVAGSDEITTEEQITQIGERIERKEQ